MLITHLILGKDMIPKCLFEYKWSYIWHIYKQAKVIDVAKTPWHSWRAQAARKGYQVTKATMWAVWSCCKLCGQTRDTCGQAFIGALLLGTGKFRWLGHLGSSPRYYPTSTVGRCGESSVFNFANAILVTKIKKREGYIIIMICME